MKPRIFILTTIFITGGMICHGQQWVGDLFTFDTAITISSGIDLNVSRLCYCIDEGTLYYTDIQSFQNKETDYTAAIYTLSLNDYAQNEIHLPMPRTETRKAKSAANYWINDMHFHNDTLVISTQDQILLYHKAAGSEFEYDTLFKHNNVKATYLYNGKLYYFEEDHDTGYKWFRQSLRGGDEMLVKELPYEAPHVVQANPNRYLFHTNNYLFYLSTRYPILHKYSLEGTWMEDIVFDIPDWHPFDDDYIQKSLSVPYGIERIRATMSEIFKYSYPKYVFPFGNSYLLYHTQYDPSLSTCSLQFSCYDTHQNTLMALSAKDTCQSTYNDQHFPFDFFHPYADKAQISWNDYFIEITADDTTEWRGKTPQEFQKSQESFYKHNDPVFKIRILRYKNNKINNDFATMPFFVDTENRLNALYDLPLGKSVLLITNQLECSACKKKILELFNNSSSQTVNIGILHSYIPGALQEREIRNNIQRHLEKPFGLYYLARNRFKAYPQELFPDETTYPAIMFYETGKAPILFSNDSIFTDDIFQLEFRTEFLKIWDQFNNN